MYFFHISFSDTSKFLLYDSWFHPLTPRTSFHQSTVLLAVLREEYFHDVLSWNHNSTEVKEAMKATDHWRDNDIMKGKALSNLTTMRKPKDILCKLLSLMEKIKSKTVFSFKLNKNTFKTLGMALVLATLS